MRRGRQWATAVEAYHLVPINSPPAPYALYQPAQSLCHYAMTFVWTTLKLTGCQQRQLAKTGSVTEVEERVSDSWEFYSWPHYNPRAKLTSLHNLPGYIRR